MSRASLTFVVGVTTAIAAGSAPIIGGAVQTPAQSIQYRSPAGVEYRSLPDTEAVTKAQAAFAADPRNVARIIDLGVAQSGARQFREAIATFTLGLDIEPDNALLLRWRGHRYLSVREFDRALADLTRGSALDSTIYGIWYHLGIVPLAYGLGNWYLVRGDKAQARALFERSVKSGGWPGFGFILSEVELSRIR